MKKMVTGVLVLTFLIFAVLSGCSERPSNNASNSENSGSSQSQNDNKPESDGKDKIRLSVYSTIAQSAVQDVMRSIAADFMKENSNIQVDLQFPGAEYENILKVKMAATDLPDVFDTHGWAKVRYSNYLADLRDESWASNLTETIKPVVTDDDGKVYAMVMSEAKDGIAYSVDILEEYNIEPPKTFEDLMAAAEKIKTESNGEISPFFMSGIDNNMIGVFLDMFATSYFISPSENDAESLLDGTFDWNKWTPLAQRLLDLKQKGYLIADVLTAKRSDLPQRFAEGKIAFVMGLPSFADDVYQLNPDARIGIMPVPSVVPGDGPTFAGGERYTMGAWKDSNNLEEAKKLIAFYAKPENMTKIANATKMSPGLKDVPTDHEFARYYKQYEDIRVFPYFDRVYLPNGMWSVIVKSGTELIAEVATPERFAETMKQEVERLRNQ